MPIREPKSCRDVYIERRGTGCPLRIGWGPPSWLGMWVKREYADRKVVIHNNM